MPKPPRDPTCPLPLPSPRQRHAAACLCRLPLRCQPHHASKLRPTTAVPSWRAALRLGPFPAMSGHPAVITSFSIGTPTFTYRATENPLIFRCDSNAAVQGSLPTNCLYMWRFPSGQWMATECPATAALPSTTNLEADARSVWRYHCAHTAIRQGWHRWKTFDAVTNAWHTPLWFYTTVLDQSPAQPMTASIVVEGPASDSDLDNPETGPPRNKGGGGKGGKGGGGGKGNCFRCGNPGTGGGGRAGGSSGFAGPAQPTRPPPW